MIVCIDNSGEQVLVQAVDSGRVVASAAYEGDVVEALARFLKERALSPTAYCPVVGVGSFSATRAAVSAANALALADNAVAVEITRELWHTIPALERHVATSQARFAQGAYSAPPRITKPSS